MTTKKNKTTARLGDLDKLARQAYQGTSFDYEVRGWQALQRYEKMLAEDLELLPEDQQQGYTEKFSARVRALLRCRCSLVSPMITGQAGINAGRENDKQDAYDKAEQKFHQWRDRSIERAYRLSQREKPLSERDEEVWRRLRRIIEQSCRTVADIDKGEIIDKRKRITDNICARIEKLARKGNTEFTTRALTLIRSLNDVAEKPIFSARHRVWRLDSVAAAAKKKAQERAAQGRVEIPFKGGTLVKNYTENLLQILFDEAPDRPKRENLYKHGFRWSLSTGLWQRQLTDNALCSALLVLPIRTEQLFSK